MFKRLGVLAALHAAMVFALSAQTFTTLYSFGGENAAGNPVAALVQGADGQFYGTSVHGGFLNYGALFKITTAGTVTTLHAFCRAPLVSGTLAKSAPCPDGGFPYDTLVLATNGDFYGTTEDGEANSAGTVFKFAPSGELSVLYNFCSQSGCTDGSDPYAGLVQATNGDFYGTTFKGGASAMARSSK